MSQLVEEIITEESRVIATEQLEIGMQYVKVNVGDTDTQITEHDSASSIATLQRELTSSKLTIERLTSSSMIICHHSVNKVLLLMSTLSFILVCLILN